MTWMFRKKALLASFLLLPFLAACASPLVRNVGKAALKFSRKFSASGFPNIPEKDRARARALARFSRLSERSENTTSLSAMNAAVYYTAQVGVGTPPAYRTLLLDVGSSNTWVGAENPYIATDCSIDTGNGFFVMYGSGEVSGKEWLDTITFAPDLVVQRQSIGVANWTLDMHGFDGMLGLGPVDLTTGTVLTQLQVPTVMDNLYAQGTITREVLGILLAPDSQSCGNGELVLGGYDESATTSAVNYVPLTTTYPSSKWWGIDQSISYGNTMILSSNAGIIDSGTTLILIATEAFQKYQSLTGATLDSTTGLLTITPSQYANLQALSFDIGGTSYNLIPNAQIWPRTLNSVIGGTSGAIYLVVSDIGSPDGELFSFINGYTFLERYYSIFDTTGHRFGIAETNYTNADEN